MRPRIAPLGLVLLLLCSCFAAQTNSRAPGPPTSGPGSPVYRHDQVRELAFGQDQDQIWVFYPAEPQPAQTASIVFCHAWGVTRPDRYRGWINHMVRKGFMVFYPRMQRGVFSDDGGLTSNAARALAGLLAHEADLPVKPDPDKWAVFGHSAGGNVAVNLAARSDRDGLPRFKAAMAIQPGLEYGPSGAAWTLLEDLTRIPSQTLLLVITSDRDQTVGDLDAKKIYARTAHLGPDNRDYITLHSDNHGRPVLKADHKAPFASAGKRPSSTNALDWNCFWKLGDAICAFAFYGRSRDVALGNTDSQRFMGKWSDGTPVRPLTVTDTPQKDTENEHRSIPPG